MGGIMSKPVVDYSKIHDCKCELLNVEHPDEIGEAKDFAVKITDADKLMPGYFDIEIPVNRNQSTVITLTRQQIVVLVAALLKFLIEVMEDED